MTGQFWKELSLLWGSSYGVRRGAETLAEGRVTMECTPYSLVRLRKGATRLLGTSLHCKGKHRHRKKRRDPLPGFELVF